MKRLSVSVYISEYGFIDNANIWRNWNVSPQPETVHESYKRTFNQDKCNYKLCSITLIIHSQWGDPPSLSGTIDEAFSAPGYCFFQ